MIKRGQRPSRTLTWAIALLLAFLFFLLPGETPAAEAIDWPEAFYNPHPSPDDVLLPLPCGGAMAFRWVQANGRVPAQTPADLAALYRLSGPWQRHGSRYLLIGKYEVSELQYQVVQAQATGRVCPPPTTAGRQVQGRVGWHDALGYAGAWSRWLLENASRFPPCTGTSPCLPRQDDQPAFLRLPLEAEWEYAARGGLAATPAQFAEPTYPMPQGLARHAWYSANTEGRLRPLGLREANPLGLHDLYGNVEELMLELYRDARFPGQAGAAVVRGGSVHTSADDLIASRRREVPLYDSDGTVRASDNGFRLVAAVALAGVGAALLADTADALPPPKAPRIRKGHLQVNVDVPAEVSVDGEPAGRVSPGAPVNLTGLTVGAHQVAVSAAGYTPVSERHQVQAHQWTQVAIIMTPRSEKVLSETVTWLVVLTALTAGLFWLFYRRRTVAETGLKPAVKPPPRLAERRLDVKETPTVKQTPTVPGEPPPVSTPAPGQPTPLPPPEQPFEPEMIALPGGTFWMGSPAEEPERSNHEGPRHKVKLPPFAIGKYAVAFEEYDCFAEATGRKLPDDQGWGRGRRPVINVSWHDAVAYAAWLSEQTGKSYRLPTEAEWEYAARAGTTTPFWAGRCIHTDQVNYYGHHDYHGCGAKTGVFRGETMEVGSLPANPWYLHEVHGNVWEWVQDGWHNNYRGAPVDGRAWETGGGLGRVLRGGSWVDEPRVVRSASRLWYDAGNRSDLAGFRPARTLNP
jgi:formylglycine-generating enzyme required for sulfatase activity